MPSRLIFRRLACRSRAWCLPIRSRWGSHRRPTRIAPRSHTWRQRIRDRRESHRRPAGIAPRSRTWRRRAGPGCASRGQLITTGHGIRPQRPSFATDALTSTWRMPFGLAVSCGSGGTTYTVQPRGMTPRQAPSAMFLMPTTKLVALRRIVASGSAVTHHGHLSRGEQRKLPLSHNQFPASRPSISMPIACQSCANTNGAQSPTFLKSRAYGTTCRRAAQFPESGAIRRVHSPISWKLPRPARSPDENRAGRRIRQHRR